MNFTCNLFFGNGAETDLNSMCIFLINVITGNNHMRIQNIVISQKESFDHHKMPFNEFLVTQIVIIAEFNIRYDSVANNFIKYTINNEKCTLLNQRI